MAVAMSDEDIESGVNSLVQTAPCPIKGMNADAWSYFLKFTAWHEGVVTCMYNNWPRSGPNPDVTYGVGTSILNKSDCKFHVQWFFAKNTRYSQPATLPDVEKDWQTAADMPRDNPWTLNDYAAKTSLEVDPAKALEGLVANVKSLVLGRLAHADFADFAKWPAQAQIAVASYCYGISANGAPKMRAAIKALDFDTAGLQSFIPDVKDKSKPGWSVDKILDHRRLFYNAARILEWNPELDDKTWKDKLPSKVHGLDLEAAKPGTTPPPPPDLKAP
jgi:hypothetical protein